MAMPATTGQLRTRVQDMQIGDYIKCHYNSANSRTVAGHFYSLGEDTAATEIPLTGLSTGLGFFYFVKVDVGLLTADRIVRNTIAWDVLNSSKYIQGRPQERDGTALDFGFDCTVRSLTGGVAYADANGNKSFTQIDASFGCFPTINEWDEYILEFPQRLIQQGKTLDDVFHINNSWTWTQETPLIGTYKSIGGQTSTQTATSRIVRGNENGSALIGWNSFGAYASNTSNALIGFRPVFEYKEV